MAHLIASDVASPAAEIPINRLPFQQGVALCIGSGMLEAKLPHIALPATFLCDAGTVSWGGTILLMVLMVWARSSASRLPEPPET